MADRMSKSEVLEHLAHKTGLKKKEVAAVVDELVLLAYKEAKNTFQISGLGIITLAERPARQMLMRFGPKAGQIVNVPAKKVLRFRFAKSAKDAILGEAPVKKDDLVIIEGIGPKIAKAYNKAGILTFKQLAETPVEKLRQILSDHQYPGDPTTWPQQAQLAAEGKMDELKQLQDALTAGRVA
ncbi:MAG: HU family DNA-binding protein [Anaerolineales bacterium]|nr:HU family DNA-binding protein [Anaerolineales bacterium]